MKPVHRILGLVLATLGPSCSHPSPPPTADAVISASPSSPVSAVSAPTDRRTVRVGTKRPWWQGAVMYEVFVRSFADGDGDGVGDLAGLTACLDALNDGDPETDDDLGVDGLWLMPIHPSPSYHGYDVVDYRGVHPDYGTMADLEELLSAAHARGMRVIIDFVLNHSSAHHPWFLAARSARDSDRRSWYVWRDQPDPAFRRPWDGSPDIWHRTETGYYYGLFWSGMPDLNLAHPPVEAEMVASMKHWLSLGMDGFRVDAVRYLIEDPDGTNADTAATHAVSRRISAAVRGEHPDALLVAEAWTGPEEIAPYFGAGGDEYQLAFGFDVAGAIMTAAKDGLRVSIDRALDTLLEVYPTPTFVAPFLTNHDMPRAMRQLAEAGAESGARPAAATLFALPGTPFVYYGEEIGMRGGPRPADEDKRTPMRWSSQAPGYGFTAAERAWHETPEATEVSVEGQRGDPRSLWSLYRDLIALRHREPALGHGELERVRIEGGGRGTTGFVRRLASGAAMLFVVNFHDASSGPFRVVIPDTSVEPVELEMSEGIEGPPNRIPGVGVGFGGLAGRGFAFVRLGLRAESPQRVLHGRPPP